MSAPADRLTVEGYLDAQRNALVEGDDRCRRPTIHKLPAYDPVRFDAWCGYDPSTDAYFGRVWDDRGWVFREQTTDLQSLLRSLRQYAHIPPAAVEVLRAERVFRDNLPFAGKEVDWSDHVRLRVDDVLDGISRDRLPDLDREALDHHVAALRAAEGHGIRIIGTFDHDARMRTLGDDGREYLVEAKRFPLVAQFDADGRLVDAAIVFDVAGDGKTRYLAQYIDAAQVQTLSQAGKLHLEPGVELSPATLGRTQDLAPEPDDELSQRQVHSQGLRR